MPSHRQLARLLPADCSAAVNTAIGMLAAQLDCGVDEAFRVLQVEAGEDPLGLERISSQILARHAYLVAHSTRSGRQYPPPRWLSAAVPARRLRSDATNGAAGGGDRR